MTQYREWTVGPIISANWRPNIMQHTGNHQPVQRFLRPEMQLTSWHNGNDMRNAICGDTQTSIKWPYYPFPKR